MTPEHAIVGSIGVCISGALVTLAASRWRTLAGWLAVLSAALAAAPALWAVGRVLTSGASEQPAAFWAVPALGFALRVHVDGLTSVFVLLTASVSLPAVVYSIAYLSRHADTTVARYYPNLLLFLAAMYGLVSTTDMMWFFFIFWQMMTLPGYALIRFEHRNASTRPAARKYLVMMQIACVVTMIGAEILAASGHDTARGSKYDFDVVSANLPGLLAGSPGMTAVAFGLFLVGFGIKMGMWPFGQVWLPDAHPAAPSPVSAMLSGVMIKTGAYGLMRYFLWLVPAPALHGYPAATWGALVAALGTVTLLTGTAQALAQEQSKRLLAYHSIGQIGYVLLGVGTCLCLISGSGTDARALAAVALCGGLFHVLNHGLFKALLFLNAGSMLHATGTQDLNRMGGLMKYMPATGATAVIAAFSISGVPLFNGFASKWVIYQSAIAGAAEYRPLALYAAVAVLTSALTLASFVKFLGAGFLSRSTRDVRERASMRRLEVGGLMQAPQILLALACVGLGTVPAIGLGLLGRALASSPHGLGEVLAEALPPMTRPLGAVGGVAGASSLAPIAIGLVMACLLLFTSLLARAGRAKRRAAEPWLCGYATEEDVNRYSAHHFYGDIKAYARAMGLGAPVGGDRRQAERDQRGSA